MQTRTSIDLLELFDSRARILQDYRWIEANIGRLVPLEIVVRFNSDSQSVGARNQASSQMNCSSSRSWSGWKRRS